MKIINQTNKIYFILIMAVIILVMVFLMFLYYNLGNNEVVAFSDKAEIKINDIVVKAEVVQSMADLAKGLSGREAMAETGGMLFILPDKKIPSFWMKDMNFPLDIIWINDNQIVDISQNIPIPDNSGYLPTFKPCCSSNYVLEVNAGFTQQNNIKAGDEIMINYLN